EVAEVLREAGLAAGPTWPPRGSGERRSHSNQRGAGELTPPALPLLARLTTSASSAAPPPPRAVAGVARPRVTCVQRPASGKRSAALLWVGDWPTPRDCDGGSGVASGRRAWGVGALIHAPKVAITLGATWRKAISATPGGEFLYRLATR